METIKQPSDLPPTQLSAADARAEEQEPQKPALVDYMTASTREQRSAAFLRTYAERLRNGTAASWEIPNTVASTLEDIANLLTDARAEDAHREQERKNETTFRDYQARVRAWVLECFGQTIADDMTERSFRFLEEALELGQSIGCTKEQAHALVDYVYGREVGKVGQEVGGVMVTLAALASAGVIDIQVCAEREYTRINTPETIAKIRRKQASKRGVVSHAAQAALPGAWSE